MASRAAEHAVAADRFARKIVCFLAVCVMRSRLLNANPLGGATWLPTFLLCAIVNIGNIYTACVHERAICLASLYTNWVLERWETLITDAKSLVLVSLVDMHGILSIQLEAQRDTHQRRFQVDFTRYPCYRNLLEEYRLELWEAHGETGSAGWTFQIRCSPWIAELEQHEPLFATVFPNLKHFLICTEDDVIEVLSDETPTFREIAPAADTPPAGKSTVLQSPKDRDKIDQIFAEVKQRQPSATN